MKEKIEAIISLFFEGNKAKFAEETGLSGSIVTNLTGGRENKPSFMALQKILGRLPEVNPDWLILSKGEMLRSVDKVPYELKPTINYELKGAPYYNVDFIGGFDILENDQTINPDCYINFPTYNKDGVVWVNLTGNSMYPELSNGDVIALRPMSTPIEHLPTNEIYAIVTEEYRTVKRIELSDRTGYIRLIPTNKDFKVQVDTSSFENSCNLIQTKLQEIIKINKSCI